MERTFELLSAHLAYDSHPAGVCVCADYRVSNNTLEQQLGVLRQESAAGQGQLLQFSQILQAADADRQQLNQLVLQLREAQSEQAAQNVQLMAQLQQLQKAEAQYLTVRQQLELELAAARNAEAEERLRKEQLLLQVGRSTACFPKCSLALNLVLLALGLPVAAAGRLCRRFQQAAGRRRSGARPTDAAGRQDQQGPRYSHPCSSLLLNLWVRPFACAEEAQRERSDLAEQEERARTRVCAHFHCPRMMLIDCCVQLEDRSRELALIHKSYDGLTGEFEVLAKANADLTRKLGTLKPCTPARFLTRSMPVRSPGPGGARHSVQGCQRVGAGAYSGLIIIIA
jgi:hypothetical protein